MLNSPLQRSFAFLLLLAVEGAAADVATRGPAAVAEDLRTYQCHRAGEEMVIDGKAGEAAWSRAPWSQPFVDIAGSERPAPPVQTRFKMLWDERFLYVYAELEEPHVWATLTKKNSMIYRDNAFEIFLDPAGSGENYYEFEVNALGTIWELTLSRPYRRGGKATSGTNLPSLRSAVAVDGTVNDASDVDRRWSVEVAIPVSELTAIKVPAKLPISVGDQWRMNFLRMDWPYALVDGRYVKLPKGTRPAGYYVWSPHGAVDMHLPERWGVVRFAD